MISWLDTLQIPIVDPPYLEVTFSDIISRKVVRRAWSSSLLEF